MKRPFLILLSLLMFLFGALQLNDPDPFLWVSIYWIVALLGIIACFRSLPNYMLQVLIAIFLFYAASFIPTLKQWISEGFPTITGKMSKARPSTELMREFFGLVISVLALVYIYRFNKRKTKNS